LFFSVSCFFRLRLLVGLAVEDLIATPVPDFLNRLTFCFCSLFLVLSPEASEDAGVIHHMNGKRRQ
jgi:hypothetical protein